MEVPKNAWFIVENPKICHGWYGGCPILGNLHNGQNVQHDLNKTRNFSSKIKLVEILLLLQTHSCCFYNSLLLVVSANDRISQIRWLYSHSIVPTNPHLWRSARHRFTWVQHIKMFPQPPKPWVWPPQTTTATRFRSTNRPPQINPKWMLQSQCHKPSQVIFIVLRLRLKPFLNGRFMAARVDPHKDRH